MSQVGEVNYSEDIQIHRFYLPTINIYCKTMSKQSLQLLGRKMRVDLANLSGGNVSLDIVQI